MKGIAALLMVVVSCLAAADDGRHAPRGFTVEKLAEGIYAVVRREPAGLAAHANNVFIVNDQDVMVVDTSQSLALTREVLAALRTITDKPVRYVINTHWHDDHYIGNQVYRDAFPDVDVVAHASAVRDLASEAQPNRLRMLEAWPAMVCRLKEALGAGTTLDGAAISEEERAAYVTDIDWGERYIREVPSAAMILPTIVVNDRLILHRGKRIIDIRSVGAGHSRADLIVNLPKEKIVVAGDLVMAPVPLTGLASSIGGWAAALGRIRTLQAETIVPGHGPVLRSDAHLRLMEELFTSMSDQVGQAASRGETLEATRTSVNLADWRLRLAGGSRLRSFLFDRYVAGPGVAAAYREATAK